MAAGWLFIVCTVVIVFDVLTRKFGFQLPGWARHQAAGARVAPAHRALLVLAGHGYLKNAHVRIDILVTDTALAPARRGSSSSACWSFALPYCLVRSTSARTSSTPRGEFNEYSDAAHRPALALDHQGHHQPRADPAARRGIVAVRLRLVVYLWGPERLRAAARIPGTSKPPVMMELDRRPPLAVPVHRARSSSVHRLPGGVRAGRHRDLSSARSAWRSTCSSR